MTTSIDDHAILLALRPILEEGVESHREQLLLWVIRNQYGVSPEDSYEYVQSDPFELLPGIDVDAVLVSENRDITSPVYLLEDRSAPRLKERVRALSSALAASDHPEKEIARRDPRLRSIFEPALAVDSEDLHRIILCVCAEPLSQSQRTAIIKASRDPLTTVEILDLAYLRALAAAESLGSTNIPDVRVETDPSKVLDLGIQNARGIVMPVPAVDIAKWPGIRDRSLFDLNVRHALGVNKVRRSLDAALRDPEMADDFIAYHNGVTAVCSDFSVDSSGVTISGLSVVNGAQTVVAIHSNAGSLSTDARVLLKLIQATPESALARNIAIRSNTQNPVTSRNLRALDPIQERLVAELAGLGFPYIVRPDENPPTGPRVIRNDDVAQLLCSVYVRKPALAVKRQVLFENPQYKEIFPDTLDSARVVFAHVTRQAVQKAKELVPDLYRGAWALTSLTVVYMASEAMRADRDFSKVLEEPGDAIREPDQLLADMAPFVEAACLVLRERRAEFESARDDKDDDFKVAFKQTRTLSELGMRAARALRKSAVRAVQR